MPSKELLEDVGKYIDKYYRPEMDDIKMDKEIIQRKKKTAQK